MKVPMPSPNGTNRERLFIDASSSAAYDSLYGLQPGFDAGPDDDYFDNPLDFVKAKLDPQDYKQFVKLLMSGGGEPEPSSGTDRKRAKDRGRSGVTPSAMDAIAVPSARGEAGFRSRFPNASLPGQLTGYWS